MPKTTTAYILLFRGVGVANTARNWNTVLRLLELASKAMG